MVFGRVYLVGSIAVSHIVFPWRYHGLRTRRDALPLVTRVQELLRSGRQTTGLPDRRGERCWNSIRLPIAFEVSQGVRSKIDAAAIHHAVGRHGGVPPNDLHPRFLLLCRHACDRVTAITGSVLPNWGIGQAEVPLPREMTALSGEMTPTIPPVRLVLVDDPRMALKASRSHARRLLRPLRVVGSGRSALKRTPRGVDELDPEIGCATGAHVRVPSAWNLLPSLGESDPKRKA